MPDTDDLKKTVDLDTSGPAMDVDVPEVKEEEIVEQKEAPVEEPTVRPVVDEKQPEDKTYENERETKLEEKKDDKELEQYSDSVQKRIAKLTKKWREAERQKDEALTYAQTVLKKQKDAESKLSKLQPDFVAVTEQSITSGVAAAQAKLAAAREANDLSAEAEALASISELGYKKAKLTETKLAQEAFEKQQKERPTPEINLQRNQAAQGTPDPKASAWADKNTWFGQDSAMTYTAFDLHKKLTEQEGFDPSSDEYYSEIDKRIRLEFPHKFANNDSSGENKRPTPVQTVASAKRSTKSGRKTVRLTPSQVAIAKKLGVPLEEYAKQLNITKEA
jgi:ATP-dependent protease HslVU (ClpYQ) peptidase subunit